MGAKSKTLGMLGSLGRRKPTPEEEIAATLRTKERVMVNEMEINPALAKQVNDGDIPLAEAQRISANQNRKLGAGKEQVMMDDNAVISSIKGADPDGIRLFEWKQGLPQKQRAAVTGAEIEYKKGNPKPLAQLYRVMGVTAAVGAGSAGAEAGPLKLAGALTPDLAAKQLKNRLNKERQKGISPGNTATDYVHRNSNYDNGFLSSIKKSGEAYGGPTYVSGVKEFAQEIFESTDDPAVKSAIMEWAKPRVARGGQVAALAGGANRAAANDGEPQEQSMIANVLDKMEQLELIPDERTRTIGMEMLKRELAKAVEWTQMSAQGLWGTGRGLFGLATGEAPHDTRRAMREVYAAPPEENLERAGQYVLKETGSPAAAAATSTLGMLTDPASWLL